MAIPSRQIGWGTEENLLWQISKQLETLTKVTYNIGSRTTTTTTTVNPNCIEFVVDTTYDTFFNFLANSSEDCTYTISWGDGETDTGSSGQGVIEASHTYPDSNQTYTARVCFSDASVIINIDFPGFD